MTGLDGCFSVPIARSSIETPIIPSLRRTKAVLNYDLDVYAIAYPGQLSPIPYRDPLEAVFKLMKLYPKGQKIDPKTFCRTCEHYDRKPSSLTASRPPGTLTRDACAGCLVSYLDPSGVDLKAIKDAVLQEWIEARERIKDLEAARRHVRGEKDKAKHKRDKEKARNRLEEAAGKCILAGFNPKRGFRPRVKRWEAEEQA